MKKPVYQNDFAYIYLTKSFYDKTKIENTILSYIEFISANLQEIGKYFVIKIKTKTSDYTLKQLTQEFSNYLLSEEYTQNKKEELNK